MSDGNGNGHTNGRAASNALKLSESTLALVARERNMTLGQLVARLTGVLVDAALEDADYAQELHGYVAAAWLGSGAPSSGQLFKRIRRGMARGILSLEEGSKALKFVQVARELETSDLDRRLRIVEQVAGTQLRRVSDEEDA